MKQHRYDRSGIFSLFMLSLLLFFSGCKTAIHENTPVTVSEIPVRVMVIKDSALVIPIQVNGMLDARNHIKLSFKTGGVILRIYTDESSCVLKGEKLAELNLSEIEARARQAKLAYQKSVRDYRRVFNLYRDSVATLEQLENVRTARDVSLNNLRIANFNLQYSVIRAPADGKILKQLAEEGEVIGAGHPVFLFASTEEAWVVRCSVPDKDIVRLREQDSASVCFDVWEGRYFSGRVTETANAADPYTGTYEVEVTLDAARMKLVSGLMARVTIFPADTLRSITIPFHALRSADVMQGSVFMYNNGVVHPVTVSIDRILDSLCVVRHGLVPGDTIIVNGVEDLDDGTPVRIIGMLNHPEP
ncbi:MAG: efflux RND transporter periplasmic adaptor subunit [Chlorobi bacterium]|nr:efflux RND transporter periplasmic adaptor subunit [Chlorobiota bacterium]